MSIPLFCLLGIGFYALCVLVLGVLDHIEAQRLYRKSLDRRIAGVGNWQTNYRKRDI